MQADDLRSSPQASRAVLVGGSRRLFEDLCRAGMPIAARIDDAAMLPYILSSCLYNTVIFVDGRLVGGQELEEAMDFVARAYPGIKTAVLDEEGAPTEALAPSQGPTAQAAASARGEGEEVAKTTRLQLLCDPGAAKAARSEVPGPAPADAPNESEVFTKKPDQVRAMVAVHPREWSANGGEWIDSPDKGRRPTVAPRQETLVVFSPKGGVGKTLIAINLAVILARHSKRRTLVMDLDSTLGDVGVHLDLLDGPTLIDLMPYSSDLGPDLLRKFSVKHPTSGLDVLLGAGSPEYAELMTPQYARKVIEAARMSYDLCVADTSGGIQSDLTLECLESCSRAILVFTPETCCVRSVKILLDSLSRVSPAILKKISLVLNRYEPSAPLGKNQVESFLGLRVVATVRESRREIEDSVYSGRPVTERNPKSPVSADIVALAGALFPDILEMPPTLKQPEGPRGLLQAAAARLTRRLCRR